MTQDAFSRPDYSHGGEQISCACEEDIDCAEGGVCNAGMCEDGEAGQCSVNGCACRQDGDCQDGALCNSRGFCTNEQTRLEGFCQKSLEELAEDQPALAILQAWVMLNIAMQQNTSDVAKNDSLAMAQHLRDKGLWTEAMTQAVPTMQRWAILVREQGVASETTTSQALDYIARVRSLLATFIIE